MSADISLIATSAFGLEAIVARELRQLGYEPQIKGTGQIHFRGDFQAIARANLWLRVADRVLIDMGTFTATDFGQLFDQTYELPWQRWIPDSGSFPVKGRSLKSQLSSVPACQRIVKKAIAEKLLSAHSVAQLDELGSTYTVEVSLHNDQATLTLDTTGVGLHKRGYRKLVGPASLKETLAAGLVLLSFWRSDRPLADPFCGSGTIPIEAALIATRRAPGLQRTFAAESWPLPGDHIWEEARSEALDLVSRDAIERILATDIDGKVLSLARQHAVAAGVESHIHWQQADFNQLQSQREYGCIITNPPYGERLGRAEEIEALYQEIPFVLRRLPTWSHFLLTSRNNFEQLVGRKADRRRKLYNARIECTYYQFFGPRAPQSNGIVAHQKSELFPAVTEPIKDRYEKQAVTQAFGGLSEKTREQAELFARRLAKRAHHLRRWPTRQKITCYRLYDRDIPEVPLIVDRYEDQLHIAEFERPHDHEPAEHADWLDLMSRTACEVLKLPIRNVHMKCRSRQRGKSQYERIDQRQERVEIREGGLLFLVNLSDYLDTGIFLDHRITRSLVRDAAENKRFLNLFGYTGTFTVYAAAGGAVQTTTVDTSNTYLQWATENLHCNGFTGEEHDLQRSDALQFVHQLTREQTFDLAVVDPPTFSNTKKMQRVWDIQRDHVDLLNNLIDHMSPGATVFFSTNSRRFKLDTSSIGKVTIVEISRQTVPSDFRNRRIHRAWKLIVDT